MIYSHDEWFASKDGKRLRILLGPEEVQEGVKKAYRDAGYVISKEEDVYDTGTM